MIRLLARVLAPFLSVSIGLLVLHNAWLTILLYHLQILLWSRGELPRLRQGLHLQPMLALGGPAIAAGPLAYLLLPRMLTTPLAGWLASVGLQGWALVAFVFYYGLVHPPLEQAHWSAILKSQELGLGGSLAFAAYHALVLQAFMRPEWMALSLAVLFVSSLAWRRVEDRASGGLAVPALSHLIADLGLILAAWARLQP